MLSDNAFISKIKITPFCFGFSCKLFGKIAFLLHIYSLNTLSGIHLTFLCWGLYYLETHPLLKGLFSHVLQIFYKTLITEYLKKNGLLFTALTLTLLITAEQKY